MTRGQVQQRLRPRPSRSALALEQPEDDNKGNPARKGKSADQQTRVDDFQHVRQPIAHGYTWHEALGRKGHSWS